MDERALQGFIKSHRAKLEQEKQNLGMAVIQSRNVGILPQDHTAIRQRDQLRRERQEEYQAFLNQNNRNRTQRRDTINTDSSRGERDVTPVLRSNSSLAEKRRALARERHQELQSNHPQRRLPYLQAPNGDDSRSNWASDDRRDDRNNGGYTHESRDDRYYSDLPPSGCNRQREQNIERGYHNGTQRRKWDDRRERKEEERSDNQRQVHFEHGYDNHEEDRTYTKGGYYNDRKRWDDEEEDLMQWARGQGKSARPYIKGPTRVPTPPLSSPPHRKPGRAGGIIDSRSLSAPVVAGGSIAALGAGESDKDKKKKQKEYAEQLRAQMREKQAAKERERDYFTSHTTSMVQQRSDDSQTRKQDNKSTASRLHSKYMAKDYRQSDDHCPPRRDRVHFSPERDARHESSHSTHESHGNPPPIPSYWPGMYYGGFHYPPPPSNFPFHPAQNGGIPFYPPPPSLPPSLSNPYLASYYAPTVPHQSEHNSDFKRGVSKHSGLKSNLSPQKVKEESAGEEELAFMLGGSGEGVTAKIDKEVYRTQLMEQMKEKRENKQRERLKRNEYNQRKDQEVYDPFGKGGCGAPLRDKRGQLVTDLKHMKKVNDERMIIGLPSTTPLPGEIAEGGAAGVLENSLTDQMSPRSSFDARRSKELRTKSVQEDYKDILMNQIREREELRRREKEMSNEAEKLETERIQRELKILEEKYRREKELEKEKQRELKIKNEAMKREKEEKEELDRKRDEELRLQQEAKDETEKKKQALIDNMERQLPTHYQQRSNSPPIPTLRKNLEQNASSSPSSHPNLQQLPQQHSTSPPVPTIRNREKLESNAILRRETSTEQPHHLPSSIMQTNFEQNTRSFSANTALLKPGGETYSHTSGGKEGIVGSSQSAHHISRPSQPFVHVQPSASDPHPSSSVSYAPLLSQKQQQLLEDDTMKNMLKKVRSMREQLETERQKVTVRNQPDLNPASDTQTSTQVNSAASSKVIKPDFLKPRLAAPRRNKHAPSNPSLSSVTIQQQQQKQQKEGQRQRKKWLPTTSNEHHSDEPVPSKEYTGTQEHDRLVVHSSSEQAVTTSTRQYKTPPIWLKPRTLLDHHDDQPRVPSAGGQSQYSISTLDVERMARRNEERMQRLESILNSQARDSRTPQTILSDFLTRNSRARNDQITSSSRVPPITTSNRTDNGSRNSQVDNETGYHRPVAASTPT